MTTSTTGSLDAVARARRANLLAALLWLAAGATLLAVTVLAPSGPPAALVVAVLVVLLASAAVGVVGLLRALAAVRADGGLDLNSPSTKMVVSAVSSIAVAVILFALVLFLLLLAGASTAP